MINSLWVILVLLGPYNLSAESDKSRFISDRPGATDSPQVSHPGKFRIEMTAWDHSKEAHKTQQNFGSIMIIAGVGGSTELQLGNTGYGQPERSFGNSLMRIKHNFWGNNDQSRSAMAVLAFYETSKAPHYGVEVPFTYQLSAPFSLDLMPKWSRTKNDGTDDFQDEAEVASVLSHHLKDNLDLFIQIVASSSLESSVHLSSYFGGGLAYKPAIDLQIDLEINSGMNAQEKDLQALAGFTFIIN